jgi:hypothetical protein
MLFLIAVMVVGLKCFLFAAVGTPVGLFQKAKFNSVENRLSSMVSKATFFSIRAIPSSVVIASLLTMSRAIFLPMFFVLRMRSVPFLGIFPEVFSPFGIEFVGHNSGSIT